MNKEMTAPNGEVGLSLQQNCDGLLALLVDEQHLVGSKTLGWMEYLCGVGTGNNSSLSWGGSPDVSFLGDDIQLPPVLYLRTGKSPAAMHDTLTWEDFNEAVVLETIVHQIEEQTHLRETLSALRNQSITSYHTT